MQRWKMLGAAFALAFAGPMFAAPVLAQTEVENAPDPWVHAATGTRFPTHLGAFTRTTVYQYSPDGRDASASYRLDRDGKWVNVTFYVYPAIAGMNCEQTFADARSHIEAYKGATVVRQDMAAPSGRGRPRAHYVRYTVPAGAMREDLTTEVRSDAYLYCPSNGKWLVKYRATGSADLEFGNEVASLLHAIPWPRNLSE